MKSVPCVEDQKVNIPLKNYLHALVRWKNLRKILQAGLELNEYLQTVNETIKKLYKIKGQIESKKGKPSSMDQTINELIKEYQKRK